MNEIKPRNTDLRWFFKSKHSYKLTTHVYQTGRWSHLQLIFLTFVSRITFFLNFCKFFNIIEVQQKITFSSASLIKTIFILKRFSELGLHNVLPNSHELSTIPDAIPSQHTPFNEDHVPIFQRVSITGEDTGGVSIFSDYYTQFNIRIRWLNLFVKLSILIRVECENSDVIIYNLHDEEIFKKFCLVICQNIWKIGFWLSWLIRSML